MSHLLQIDGKPLFDRYVPNEQNPSFQYSIAIEVGLSDLHLISLTVIKSGFVKRGQGSLCTVTTVNLIL